MNPRKLLLLLIVGAGLAASGCAAVGLTLLGVGAGLAAGTGTAYTLDGIAYRTFSAPIEDVHRATLIAFRRMDVTLEDDAETSEGRTLLGQAGDRQVHLELERLTTRATRMRVTARHGIVFRDRATAGEIVAQTEHAIDDLPALSHQRR